MSGYKTLSLKRRVKKHALLSYHCCCQYAWFCVMCVFVQFKGAGKLYSQTMRWLVNCTPRKHMTLPFPFPGIPLASRWTATVMLLMQWDSHFALLKNQSLWLRAQENRNRSKKKKSGASAISSLRSPGEPIFLYLQLRCCVRFELDKVHNRQNKPEDFSVDPCDCRSFLNFLFFLCPSTSHLCLLFCVGVRDTSSFFASYSSHPCLFSLSAPSSSLLLLFSAYQLAQISSPSPFSSHHDSHPAVVTAKALPRSFYPNARAKRFYSLLFPPLCVLQYAVQKKKNPPRLSGFDACRM